jgi:hypothetical protein
VDCPLGLGGVRSEGVGVFGILLLDVGDVDTGVFEHIAQAADVEKGPGGMSSGSRMAASRRESSRSASRQS